MNLMQKLNFDDSSANKDSNFTNSVHRNSTPLVTQAPTLPVLDRLQKTFTDNQSRI